MKPTGPWTTGDFEALSWHDVHVHGFRLDAFDEEAGAADLILDIDYILEWHECGAGYEFTVCPATLCFNRVFAFRMVLDYHLPTAGMCPFSLGGIERTPVTTRAESFHWRLPMNWPEGEMTFQSPGFTQRLRGNPCRQSAQWLDSGDR